eukprot:TRINITY_DN11298_c0_g2_i6.p1 TRINITY_DN11298_c0_g2~~TRINITY_DN11298_c0_g2_i6.p1  ORF type:complete len:160 (+),score=28.45 TRINITY_DN11298_c0_g2_i6:1-480(+)
MVGTCTLAELLLSNLSAHRPRVLPPRSGPSGRHSSVALILRVVPEDKGAGRAEILYIKRATRDRDRWSGHIAFPGGHVEDDDESPRHAAERETMEEIGLDLRCPEFDYVGRLDDREISPPSRGSRPSPKMVVSSFVFVQTSPRTPALHLNPGEVALAVS